MNEQEIQSRLDKYYSNWANKQQIVTVFLLTHKRPHYLSFMIDSILKQNYNNFYLIVLDNMSNDNTRNIVDSYGDDRIIYLERESDPLSGNFNYCFTICRTKYLVVFHDDDIIKPSYLNTMLITIDEDESISCLSCSCESIDGSGNVISDKPNQKKCEKNIIKYVANQYLLDVFIDYNFSNKWVMFPTVMYRHSFYQKNEIVKQSGAGPSGDQLLWFETCRLGGVVAVLDEPLYSYRLHSGQDSVAKYNMIIGDLLLLKFMNDNYLSYSSLFINDDLVKIRLAKFYGKHVISIIRSKNPRYSRKDICYFIKSTPSFLSHNPHSKKFLLLIRLSFLFPNITCFLYKVKVKIFG